MTFPLPEVVTSWQFWCVAVACYIICEVVKLIPAFTEHPWVVNLLNLIVGIVLIGLLLGWSGENLLFGILASAVADFAYQTFKNLITQFTGGNAANTQPELASTPEPTNNDDNDDEEIHGQHVKPGGTD